MRLRSLLLLVLAGTAVLGLSRSSPRSAATPRSSARPVNATIGWLIRIGTVLIVTAVLTSLFRLAAARSHSWVGALPGAFLTAVGWQVLQNVGAVVRHLGAGRDLALNQTFGLVLGLIGLIFIASLTAVLGIEMNVVLARRLWPRALLTPFTDAVDLTDADRKAYALYAQVQRHKGFETVTVRFDGRDGDTHEIEQVSRDRTR